MQLDAECKERSLTEDGDAASEGRDSAYGISDRQLEDLWQQVKDSGAPVRLSVTEDDVASRRDSDFGLSERQLQELQQQHRQQEQQVPIDPLGRMAHMRKRAEAAKAAQQSEGPLTSSSKIAPEQFLEDQLASLRVCRDAREARAGHRVQSGRLQMHVVSGRDIDGVTFYLIRVLTEGSELFFTKRYSQFKALDDQLRPLLPHIGKSMPPLPDAGMLGLRHRAAQWGFGDFDEKRLEGLRVYVRGLSLLVEKLSDIPLLEHFFNKVSPDRLTPKGDRFA
mmetsp:Transcript_15183/g.34614  ORF Transcript_15183/g.34614 Transcript_15183/m.34614 type:complete len:279 (+) Transcript_15183:62-898(+)